jgi:hypothetical protein
MSRPTKTAGVPRALPEKKKVPASSGLEFCQHLWKSHPSVVFLMITTSTLHHAENQQNTGTQYWNIILFSTEYEFGPLLK